MKDRHGLEQPWGDMQRIDVVLRRVANAKGDETRADVPGDVEDLGEAIERVKVYTEFRPDCFQRRPVNWRMNRTRANLKLCKRSLD